MLDALIINEVSSMQAKTKSLIVNVTVHFGALQEPPSFSRPPSPPADLLLITLEDGKVREYSSTNTAVLRFHPRVGDYLVRYAGLRRRRRAPRPAG
jgi:hypothetical protein